MATRKLLFTLAIIAVGLAGRSALDKILALRGGAELVALWAQFASVIEMVASVATTGVGAGLSVLVAQTTLPERQQLFLRRALRLGLAVTAPVALAAGIVGWRFSDALGGSALSPPSVALAPRRLLSEVPSSSISMRSMRAWSRTSSPRSGGAISSCTLAMALRTPLPR